MLANHNEIILFDGDHCNDNFKVLGFEEFDYEEYGNGIQLKGLKGIDIFVENNWWNSVRNAKFNLLVLELKKNMPIQNKKIKENRVLWKNWRK